ncbi:16S rRNA (uracil(1498)-N(3))-methyltransferase [Treponema sp.]|uniref:RsmE family RNA methyltransferase n=1 Tax=Treponema sp. TaxID=166 RepID=UPI00298E8FFE|nr:16S rRNA (uracil(1498)-N(3))-methyltransferase [Treponema sp.]
MRQFVIDTEPDSKGLVNLTGKDYRYIRQVLRLNVGDMIKAAVKDRTVDATLCRIDESKKIITLQLCDTQKKITNNACVTNNARPEFYLLQFIPKPQKMELIIRQAVEEGVSAIIPVIGEYTQKGSEKSLTKKTSSDTERHDRMTRSDRIERIIKEARQQSGSPVETKVFEPVNLKDALEIIKDKVDQTNEENKKSVCISLYERNEGSVSVFEAVGRQKKEGSIGFAVCAVGSEGGISPDEIQLLKNAGFSTVHLDVNILRCETASLYGMAVLQTAVLEGNVWQLNE